MLSTLREPLLEDDISLKIERKIVILNPSNRGFSNASKVVGGFFVYVI